MKKNNSETAVGSLNATASNHSRRLVRVTKVVLSQEKEGEGDEPTETEDEEGRVFCKGTKATFDVRSACVRLPPGTHCPHCTEIPPYEPEPLPDNGPLRETPVPPPPGQLPCDRESVGKGISQSARTHQASVRAPCAAATPTRTKGATRRKRASGFWGRLWT
tara:strand:- start:985 stop:1470 length:486 start_codon:yes stop_codon:yes gene_type:complete